ncbi:hypothetical protein [Campylobacter sputorum]|uniref:hypothetical protein n=1 Tax=Campylobacter sputorum TaxID=206 RepID=UPI00053BE314|nr:hypothetical protein [Campylobacter sputorum]
MSDISCPYCDYSFSYKEEDELLNELIYDHEIRDEYENFHLYCPNCKKEFLIDTIIEWKPALNVTNITKSF